jgi:uncharacterized membrane-anchored protein
VAPATSALRKRHALVWAREIQFGDNADHTLNYDLRVLGRRGVLSMNIVSKMQDLDTVRSSAAGLEPVATFDAGARYADYQAGSDKKADYGVAGLIAAGVGAVAAKKLGLLALFAVFAKKLGVLAVAGFAAVAGTVKRLFRRKRPASE